MTAKLLSGKEVSEAMLAKVLSDSEDLISKGITPKLAVFRIGEDPGSISYEKSIITRMAKSKIEVQSVTFAEDVSQEDFIKGIKEANEDKSINSILIFKPLPEQINEDEIKYVLSPEKDPDAFNPTNLGKLMIMDDKGFYPCTAEGVMELLRYYNIDVKGKDVTIINNSNVLGKPLAIMLTNEFATVSICHVFTKSVKDYTLKSDIVITACGIYGLVTPDMLRDDAILIRCGHGSEKGRQQGIRAGRKRQENTHRRRQRGLPRQGSHDHQRHSGLRRRHRPHNHSAFGSACYKGLQTAEQYVIINKIRPIF